MKAFDYLAPGAVLAAMIQLGARPTWVSGFVFLVAVAYFAAERLATAWKWRGDMWREKELIVAKYGAEVEALRAEMKIAVDAVKASESKAVLNKRMF